MSRKAKIGERLHAIPPRASVQLALGSGNDLVFDHAYSVYREEVTERWTKYREQYYEP